MLEGCKIQPPMGVVAPGERERERLVNKSDLLPVTYNYVNYPEVRQSVVIRLQVECLRYAV